VLDYVWSTTWRPECTRIQYRSSSTSGCWIMYGAPFGSHSAPGSNTSLVLGAELYIAGQRGVSLIRKKYFSPGSPETFRDTPPILGKLRDAQGCSEISQGSLCCSEASWHSLVSLGDLWTSLGLPRIRGVSLGSLGCRVFFLMLAEAGQPQGVTGSPNFFLRLPNVPRFIYQRDRLFS
jgi:hypothetical protein